MFDDDDDAENELSFVESYVSAIVVMGSCQSKLIFGLYVFLLVAWTPNCQNRYLLLTNFKWQRIKHHQVIYKCVFNHTSAVLYRSNNFWAFFMNLGCKLKTWNGIVIAGVNSCHVVSAAVSCWRPLRHKISLRSYEQTFFICVPGSTTARRQRDEVF